MTFQVSPTDLRPVLQCPLALRWTQPSHAVLTAEELSGMACFVPVAAREVAATSLLVHGPEGLLTPPVSGLRTLPVGEPAKEQEVRAWLERLPTGSEQEVIASWTSEIALFLPWSVFVTRWNDFCYPASDDITVFPVSQAWVLAYHHYDVFQWGRWRAA
jgi:hypothetical protein